MKNYNKFQLWKLKRRAKRIIGWYYNQYRPTISEQDFYKKTKNKEVNIIKKKFILEAYMRNIPPVILSEILGVQEDYILKIVNKERNAA